MGTNYYAIPKATEESKRKIIDAATKEDWGSVKSLIPESIHIGKSSAGWAFIFNHNNWKYFEKSEKSLADFLDGCLIYDEYNMSISASDFWRMVYNKRVYQRDTTYGTMEDGLNFSNSTDFS